MSVDVEHSTPAAVPAALAGRDGAPPNAALPLRRRLGLARWLLILGVASLLGLLSAVGAAWWVDRDGGDDRSASPPSDLAQLGDPAVMARGAYLARVGNCAGCHTVRGGAAYAGGRGIATPFGTVYAGNLTPDAATGLGAWNADDFWRALHLGRSRDGRRLLPAFPYTDLTQVQRADSDALFAYLRSLPPVARPNTAHTLRFPYKLDAAVMVWRALYFTPGTFVPESGRLAEWNRGAYLVRGLGHCASCHAPRNALGAVTDARSLAGGEMPMQPWYAPPLAPTAPTAPGEAALQATVALLKTGVSDHGVAMGLMAEVVFRSTQYWTDADLRAAAVYLQALPAAALATAIATPPTPKPAPEPALSGRRALGAQLYDKHCADCHGAQGQGAPGAYPPLAGNPSVTQASVTNLIQTVLQGGFAPSTAGNPRPYGMPPTTLSEAEVALVLSHVRHSWGNAAAPVSALDVMQHVQALR